MCSRTANGAWAAILTAALAALTLSGCGNKESPKPPPQIIPVPTLDLRVAQRGNELLLTFTYPTTTVAGAALGDLESVEFWELVREMRLIAPTPAAPEAAATGTTAGDAPAAVQAPAPTKEDLAAIDPAEFVAAAKLRLTLKEAELDDAISGSQITARFPLEPLPEPAPEPVPVEREPEGEAEGAAAADAPVAEAEAPESDAEAEGDSEPEGDAAEEEAGEEGPLEKVYLFAIKTVPVRGLTSNFSNVVKIVQRRPPPPPAELEVEPSASGIVLSWKGDEEAAPGDPAKGQGHRIYRRGAQARAYGEPLQVLPAGYSRFVDATAEFGRRYIYTVTAVALTNPVVESAIGAEHEVQYEDRFPPPAPTNAIALPEAGAVRLIWDAVDDRELLGYFVERAEGEGDFSPIHDEPLTDLEITDRDVISGRAYRYRVYAVDAEGNRGKPTEAIEVRAP